MSHVEPEHNRPQEGEEPDQPFPPITKEWLLERAHLEEGLEIGAGRPDNAATGGWTVRQWIDAGGEPRNSWDIRDSEGEVVCSDLEQHEADKIVVSHNVALAAAEQAFQIVIRDAAELERQLAAERKERDCANDDYHALQQEYDKLEKQLAAEKEKYLHEARAWFDRDKQLRDALAAERQNAKQWQFAKADVQDQLAALRQRVRDAAAHPKPLVMLDTLAVELEPPPLHTKD